MLLIPAIDLKDGHCVRLKQGVINDSTHFADDPTEPAQRWLQAGARRLHIVDLNGAFAGEPKNETAVRAIADVVKGKIPIQLGGGIRDLKTIDRYLSCGITDIIIGTAAIKNPEFLKQACAEFKGRVMIGLDAKEGKIAIDGWQTITTIDAIDFVKDLQALACKAIIYTDISRDGMLNGINVKSTLKMAESTSIPIVASGGLSYMADIEAFCQPNKTRIAGIICGTAIYSGQIDFAKAQQQCDAICRDVNLAQQL